MNYQLPARNPELPSKKTAANVARFLCQRMAAFCRPQVILLPFLCLLVAISGCGYHLGEIRPTPMRTIKALAVPTFKNRTYKPRIEVLAATILIKRLLQDGTYKIVDEDTADAILECTINKIEHRAMRSSVVDVLVSTEFEMRIHVSYLVTDRTTGRVLMQGEKLGVSSFFVTSDLTTAERQAMPNAFTALAEEITSEVSEGW